MKKALLGLIIGSAIYSINTNAFELPEKIDAKFYGQINKAMMYASDGELSKQFIVDNDNSSTRFGSVGSVNVGDDGLSVGYKVEASLQSNSAMYVDMNTRSTDFDWGKRHMEIFLKGKFGKISGGMGDGAANGNIEADYSGTLLALLPGPMVGYSLKFQDNGVYGPSIGQVLNYQDFESRYDRVRYDTPSLRGTVLSISSGIKNSHDVFELALRSKQSLGDTGKLDMRLGFSSEDVAGVADKENTFGGSISYLADNGFSMSLAASRKSDDNPTNPDSDYRSVRFGYQQGNHKASILYGQGDDQNLAGDKATVLGAAYLFKPASWVDTYISYSVHSLDRSGADFDDINILLAGARLKF